MLQALYQQLRHLPSTAPLPALFIGHGSPMNAITRNTYTESWANLGRALPRPAAILCISAHWMTDGHTAVLTALKPKTIHDFYGFPPALNEKQYPAPGAPDKAVQTQQMVKSPEIRASDDWGFDHGTWSILCSMYPDASVPVYQLSIDMQKNAAEHLALAKQLKPLREQGVLIVGSGNIVHNLGKMHGDENAEPFDWTQSFDRNVKTALNHNDSTGLLVNEHDALTQLAHPTLDHYYPLLYTQGVRDNNDELFHFNETFMARAISMRSVVITR